MNQQTLEKLIEQTSSMRLNYYDINSLTEFDLVRSEIDKLNIDYDLSFYKNKPRMQLKDENGDIYKYIHYYYPNNTLLGWHTSNNKYLSEVLLRNSNLRTTNSNLFLEHEYDKAFDFFKKRKKNLIIKPLSLSSGVGIFLDLDEKNFQYCWDEAFLAQKSRRIKNPKVLLQELVDGFEIRVVVIDGKVTKAILRFPPYVIGNGISTIRELIMSKNSERKKSPYYKTRLINLNKSLEINLKNSGYDLNDILEDQKPLLIHKQSNIAIGGENFEITNLLHSNTKKLAINATLAIPGLHTSGVDIMIKDFDDPDGTILEINKSPDLTMLYYPKAGNPSREYHTMFESLIIQHDFLNEKITEQNMTEKSLKIIRSRYDYLYKKDLAQQDLVKNLFKENQILKNKLDDLEKRMYQISKLT